MTSAAAHALCGPSLRHVRTHDHNADKLAASLLPGLRMCRVGCSSVALWALGEAFMREAVEMGREARGLELFQQS